MKIPLYHLKSNGIAERIVTSVKMGLKAYSPGNGFTNEYFKSHAFELSVNSVFRKSSFFIGFDG